MNATQKDHPVKMTRANLDSLPEFKLPSGFALRWYQPDDEAHWLRIHLAAEQFNPITPEIFQKQFVVEAERGLQPASARVRGSGLKSALQELRERQCYLLAPTDEVIGTGTAWFNDNFEGARWGRVHWMAVAPEFQGRGLGNALLFTVCTRLRELGHERAYLTTSTARIPAIKMYLKFGFAPVIRCAEDEVVWKEILATAER